MPQLDAMVTRDPTASALWRSLVLEAELTGSHQRRHLAAGSRCHAAASGRRLSRPILQCVVRTVGPAPALPLRKGGPRNAGGFQGAAPVLGVLTSRAALEVPGSAPVVFVLRNDQPVSETQPPPCPG